MHTYRVTNHATIPGQQKRAVIYCRISEDREGRELGVQRQEDDCRALAERMGYTVVRVYSDNDIGASTRSRKKPRPQYRQMLADARAGQFEMVTASTSARLTRKPREREDLIELAEQHGVRFEYVSSPSFDLNTADGRHVARLLASGDTAESERISERAKRQREQAATAGQWSGGRRPYGYDADGMTVLPVEAAEVLKASEAILAGASVIGLVRDWNTRGLTTTAGAPWTGRSLTRMLCRPRNAGLMEHRGQVIGQAKWPAIVPEPVWRGVEAILSNPERRTTPGPGRRWLGSGLYFCHCGATVRVHTNGGSNRSTHHAYVCSVTKHLTRKVSEVDDFVGRAVIERMSSEDAVGLLARPGGVDTASLAVESVALREQLDDLASLLTQGVLTKVGVRRESEKLREQIESIEQQMAEASRGSALAGLAGAPDVRAMWESPAMTLDRKRAVINELMTVRILPSRRGRPPGWTPGRSYFDPGTVEIVWKVTG